MVVLSQSSSPVNNTAIRLPEPLLHQQPILDSLAPRKLLRCGRRFGKSRLGMIAGLAGHGPGEYGQKLFPGVLQGRDIVWVAQDYPNLSTVMWREEFIPRLKHLPFVKMNAQEHTITFDRLGTLFLRPETAIGGIRGIGRNLGGVILDEGAFYDLEASLQDVILPALLDNGGWLIIMSTTNAGPDGNQAKRIPSYFNILCEQVRSGARSEEWEEFTGTAFDNPRLSHQAINELIAEYPPNSPKLKQEVYAELLVAGIGLALPQLSASVHIVPRYPIPPHWRQFGGFDWGYNHPWVFGWYAIDEDGNIVKLDTLWGREQIPSQIGETVNAIVPVKQLNGIHAGSDIFYKKGTAIGFQGPTIAEQLVRDFQWKLVQSDTRPGSRASGLDNFRRYVHYERAENGSVTKLPRFTMLDTEGNRRCLAQLQSMQLDPDDLEDALKIDADISGRGGDDSYDETRMALMSRPIASVIPKPIHPQGTVGHAMKATDRHKQQLRRQMGIL